MPALTIAALGENHWRLHASAVQLSDARAVLILGVPDTGKTVLAAHFLAQGAALIGDDYLELEVRQGQLYARPPETIAGVLALRGQPLVRVPHVAGVRLTHQICLSDYHDDLASYTGVSLPEMAPPAGVSYNTAAAFVQGSAALSPEWFPQNIKHG